MIISNSMQVLLGSDRCHVGRPPFVPKAEPGVAGGTATIIGMIPQGTKIGLDGYAFLSGASRAAAWAPTISAWTCPATSISICRAG